MVRDAGITVTIRLICLGIGMHDVYIANRIYIYRTIFIANNERNAAYRSAVVRGMLQTLENGRLYIHSTPFGIRRSLGAPSFASQSAVQKIVPHLALRFYTVLHSLTLPVSKHRPWAKEY